MAAIEASPQTFSVSCTGSAYKQPVAASSPFLLGLPAMAKKGRVTCSLVKKEASLELGMGASLVAAAAAASAAAMAGPATALVDERMSTEGTGLPFGLSNNLLGWILVGVFGVIWALYTVYTSTLDEDDDSGLSL